MLELIVLCAYLLWAFISHRLLELIVLCAYLLWEYISRRRKETDVLRTPSEESYQPILDLLDSADEHMSKNEIREAIEVYKSALLCDLRPIERLKVYCTLASAYLLIGNNSEAVDAALKAHHIDNPKTMQTELGSFLLGFARGKLLRASGMKWTLNYLPPYCEAADPVLNLRKYQMILCQFFAPIIGGVLGAYASTFINSPTITVVWIQGTSSIITFTGTIIGLLVSDKLFTLIIGIINKIINNRKEAISKAFWSLFLISALCLIVMPTLFNDPQFWVENVLVPGSVGIIFVNNFTKRFIRTMSTN